jgi:hypothetical protein
MDEPTYVLIIERDGETLFWQKNVVTPKFVKEYPDAAVMEQYREARVQLQRMQSVVPDAIVIVENYGLENERRM